MSNHYPTHLKCKKCGKTKPIEEFSRDSKHKNNHFHRSSCKECDALYGKAYREGRKFNPRVSWTDEMRADLKSLPSTRLTNGDKSKNVTWRRRFNKKHGIRISWTAITTMWHRLYGKNAKKPSTPRKAPVLQQATKPTTKPAATKKNSNKNPLKTIGKILAEKGVKPLTAARFLEGLREMGSETQEAMLAFLESYNGNNLEDDLEFPKKSF